MVLGGALGNRHTTAASSDEPTALASKGEAGEGEAEMREGGGFRGSLQGRTSRAGNPQRPRCFTHRAGAVAKMKSPAGAGLVTASYLYL
jgi:hypothetical protein